MLDIGTRADKHAVYKLYKYINSHKNCGGCCGEIEVDFGESKCCFTLEYLVKACQFYEYKMGHTPDKCCESFFGYNSVLPGAYSMFRWEAIQGQPLRSFFKGIAGGDLSCGEANQYLAEDRVMCYEIITKKRNPYTLTYIPEAKAFTDVPPNLTVLIKQRRRWINGSIFGTWNVIRNVHIVLDPCRTSHWPCFKLGLLIFMIYYIALFILSFLLIGAMFSSVTVFFMTKIEGIAQ